jgi:xanthosine utilization system XapX-like protein
MVILYVKLAFATAVVLAPGWLVARALGVRSVSATLAWSLVAVFGALALTFALGSTLTLTIVGLAIVALLAAAIGFSRGWPHAAGVPRRGWAFFWGAIVGVLLWIVAPSVQGDGLFHLARARKLLELDALSLNRVSEFADGSLHPGYAFPLWHGFIALIAKVSGEDPERVVTHLPSLLAPLAVVVAFEVGWALFRRTWAAGVTAAAQVAMIAFAPGLGGAYVFLSLPATASRQLLVPAALALALEFVRAPSIGLVASTAAAGLALAVVHPTYAIFLWIPFVGFLVVRALWERKDAVTGALALGALFVPAALFMLWLRPIVNDTRSVSPDADELQRAFEQYGSQLVVHSDTSYNLAPEVFTRAGAVAIAALLLIPLAGFAARRRWAAYVVGGSLAVFAVMLLPFVFPALSDLVSISQARRAAGFLPFAFAFAGGMGVLARLVGPLLLPLALGAGMFLQIVYPGDFDYVLRDPAPAWIAWFGVVGAVAALVVGFARKRPALETGAALAAAAFLVPVFGGGLLDWNRPDPPEIATLTPGLVGAVHDDVRAGAIVYSDPETSFRLAASAPVYIAVAPPGHVADTAENRPYERARDARRFQRTGDLAIPREYGADYVVVDRMRTDLELDLPVVFADDRFTIYRL